MILAAIFFLITCDWWFVGHVAHHIFIRLAGSQAESPTSLTLLLIGELVEWDWGGGSVPHI